MKLCHMKIQKQVRGPAARMDLRSGFLFPLCRYRIVSLVFFVWQLVVSSGSYLSLAPSESGFSGRVRVRVSPLSYKGRFHVRVWVSVLRLPYLSVRFLHIRV